MADSGENDETGTTGSSASGRQRRSSETSEVPSPPSGSGGPGGHINEGHPTTSSSHRAPSARRKFRTLTFGRHYETNVVGGQKGASGGCGGGGASGGGASGSKDASAGKKKRKNPWTFRINYRLRRDTTTTDIPDPNSGSAACVCTGYRRTEEHHLGAGLVFQAAASALASSSSASSDVLDQQQLPTPRRMVSVDVAGRGGPYDDYPIEDWDDKARAERARELEEGVDPPPGYRPSSVSPLLSSAARQATQLMPTSTFDMRLSDLAIALQSRLTVQRRIISVATVATSSPTHVFVAMEPAIGSLDEAAGAQYRRSNVHTQVDYIHCLVPDLLDITRCAFYWGKMDRYEAERLLDGRPEGYFLLRDSAQDEYLFSVSFRRYGRSLHARVEQWNHRFSFDSHDPGVYSSTTVCGLVEHYKDPTCCMFFEPMLTVPLHRTFPFPLQHLCRAAIVGSRLTYDDVNDLRLPKPLKAYVKEYHYKQRVRVRLFEQ